MPFELPYDIYCLTRHITAPAHLVMVSVDIRCGSGKKQRISVGKLGYFRPIFRPIFGSFWAFLSKIADFPTRHTETFCRHEHVFAPWVVIRELGNKNWRDFFP